MNKNKETEEPFDESIRKLESILGELERGDLPLEKSIDMFESGMELVRRLGKRLDVMETRIRKLVEKDGGELSLEPFEPERNDEA